MSDPAPRGSRLHLIGVGGSGMLPLALLLQEAGRVVTGSDPFCAPGRLALLEARGVTVSARADAARLDGVAEIITSPAIPETHVERRAARRMGLPIATRAHALSALIANRPTVCVAGSHGKSTTTAMLVHILDATGDDAFGFMLGAAFAGDDRPPARLGSPGALFVTEACEAHGALSQWRPTHAILTNLDDDHADHYGGAARLRQAFAGMLARTPADGRIVVCGDDPDALEAAKTAGRTLLSYGFGAGNALRAVPNARGAAINLDGEARGALTLAVPGRHNLLNALGALGMALALGVTFETAIEALATFRGVGRRLERIETASALRLFDDFAHHPAEIAASIAAVREAAPGRVIAVVEPQLHSRVSVMAPAFAEALTAADRSYLLPVAALGETRQADGDAALADACRAAGRPCVFVDDPSQLLERLQNDLREDDTLLVMAAASGAGLARRLAQGLPSPTAQVSASGVLLGDRRAAPPDLLSLVAAHAARAPDAPAVEMGHRRLSYADLIARVGDLTRSLQTHGVGSGDSVGVCLGRSVDRVTAFLAILQLGAVFVPLDPALPGERLAHMLETSGARTVVVNAASPALPEMGLTFVNCGLLPDRDSAPHDAWRPTAVAPGAVAYMIFTSGTTGQPKAVEVSRGALANYAVAATRHFEITSDARVSQVCGFGFDVSVGDMAMALAAGACLVFPTDIQATSGPAVGRFIAEAGLSHLSLTPSALSVVPTGAHPRLGHVIVVGEACSPALVDRWGPGRTFINAYGPTEATVEATFAVCAPGRPVTIGRPIDNMGACILDAALRPVAPGEEGELCLFGIGLAKGYRHQEDLTAERFPTVAIPGQGEVRVYRTGDRVKAAADGALIYLGRLDSQLKFKGHRIEPGEVEAALCDLPTILDAAVGLASSPQAPDRLVAHLVMAPGAPAPDPVALRGRLLERLPAYMAPSVFLPAREIPRNANGKRDREALPLPPSLTQPPAARTVGSPTEAAIMALVDAHAGAGTVAGTRDSLLDAGVDSLAMANLLFAIEEAFGVTLDAGFEPGFDTVEVLALMVDAQRSTPLRTALPGVKTDLAARIMPHLATWRGHRQGKAGLARSLDGDPTLPKLFWCFQSGHELVNLHKGLTGVANVVGLRSGHLAVEYAPETLRGLGQLYADEIADIQPAGPLVLGGNCQGGLVMREAGLELMRRGRDVALTILMEQGRFFHYPGRTLLVFGAGSYLNPYGQIEAPEQLFRTAYPGGHHVEIISGAHGQYFTPENIGGLSAAILRHLEPNVGQPPLAHRAA